MKPPYRGLYISKPAYQKLCILTMEKGYSNHSWLEDVTRMRGLHLLIENVVHANDPIEDWFDMRPDYLKSQARLDPYSLDSSSPTVLEAWQDFDDAGRPTKRSIKITDGTMAKLMTTAIHFSVRSNRKPASHTSANGNAMVGMVLEAWGLGYLQPRSIPANPNSLTHTKEFVAKMRGDTSRSEPLIYF